MRPKEYLKLKWYKIEYNKIKVLVESVKDIYKNVLLITPLHSKFIGNIFFLINYVVRLSGSLFLNS